jgi:hypothetical protein
MGTVSGHAGWRSRGVTALLALGGGLFGLMYAVFGGFPSAAATVHQTNPLPVQPQRANERPTSPAVPVTSQSADTDSTGPERPARDPTHKTVEQISGLYVLGLEGRPPGFLKPFLENRAVDGFSLRAGWSEVEPREGTFDWSMFDSVIAEAAAHGKKVMLRVLPGVRTPEWVYAAGAARFEFVDESPHHATRGQTLCMPVPWDPVYLAKWLHFVSVFGARYADNPAVVIVAITGPSSGGEMHLVEKAAAARWRSAGYSSTALMEAWKRAIDAFTAAFPSQHRTVAIAHPTTFGDAEEVVEEVVRHCAQTGCGIQGNWLAAKTRPQNPLYRHVAAHSAIAPVGFQMLSAAGIPRFGGDLRSAVDLALKANACFLEVYLADVSRYPDDIAYAHEQLTRMKKLPPPRGNPRP